MINVETAKANYQKHQKDLERMRKKYIKVLSKQIKQQSRRGAKFIDTADLMSSFMTYAYMTTDLKEYFEQRGFTVTVESTRSGAVTSWLRIRWSD